MATSRSKPEEGQETQRGQSQAGPARTEQSGSSEQTADQQVADQQEAQTEANVAAMQGESDPDAEVTPTVITQPAAVQVPATIEDPVTGIERIVQPVGDGWEPAPIEVSDEHIAAVEAAEVRAQEAKDRRLNQFQESGGQVSSGSSEVTGSGTAKDQNDDRTSAERTEAAKEEAKS